MLTFQLKNKRIKRPTANMPVTAIFVLKTHTAVIGSTLSVISK